MKVTFIGTEPEVQLSVAGDRSITFNVACLLKSLMTGASEF
jgi:hypothetical protein